MDLSTETDEDILPHHVQQSLCTTRLPYRQGRKLTAVKVYTINNESNHLLIFGVPSLNLRQETKSLFLKFGKLIQFNITTHPSEQFTETYHALYENIASARLAKRMLDMKNFYGGNLHVTYAPELESLEETKEKILLRQKNVLARLKNLQKDIFDSKNVEKQNDLAIVNELQIDSNKFNTTVDSAASKIYMGDINNINIGKRKYKETKSEKRFKKNKNVDNPGNISTIVKEKYIPRSTDDKITTDNINKDFKIPEQIEIVDFTSVAKETLTNINEAINYNNFGKEVIKKVPYKPLNKIKFNLNKK